MDHARRRRLRGASMVEFAIVFPVAVLFVLALVQVGFMYMAKLTLNQATFMAARAGSLNNASMQSIRENLIRGLSPFYQDSTVASDAQRLWAAYARAQADAVPFLDITLLNPSDGTFADFGVRDPVRRVTYIPNDNLEWRSDAVGPRSGQNIRDANLLKLRVVYGYELKAPLMAGVLRWAMCTGGSIMPFSDHCARYYELGRVPIEAFATIEMQSRAERARGSAGAGSATSAVPAAPAASSASAAPIGQATRALDGTAAGEPAAGSATDLTAGSPAGAGTGSSATGDPSGSRDPPPELARHCDSPNGSECQPPPCAPGEPSCAATSTPTCESG